MLNRSEFLRKEKQDKKFFMLCKEKPFLEIKRKNKVCNNPEFVVKKHFEK